MRAVGAGRETVWYIGVVLLGSVLIVVAAIHQPFNQNELQQMGPYASNSLSKITSGTRQPPLDPLLGALVQHVLGEGQLRQRLVPVCAGVSTLVLMALLLRRLRLGTAGVLAVGLMATAPLMVRFSAYSRPYALPTFLMMVFVYAAERWLDAGRRRWLAVAGVAAAALPLARVPEPTIFLLTTVATMTWFAYRGRFSWGQAGPLIALPVTALVLVGYPMYRALSSAAPGLWSPSPVGVVHRFGGGAHEFMTGAVPLLAAWLPWWPVTGLVIVAALAVPDSRRQLAKWWFAWPLLVTPVAFVLAYHFLTTVNFDGLPYRSRSAYFFVPAYTIVVASLATSAWGQLAWPRLRVWLALLLVAALLSQLPMTVQAMTRLDAPDFAAAARLVSARVPAGDVVLYDRPSAVDQPQLAFLAKNRYLSDPHSVIDVGAFIRRRQRIAAAASIYLMVNGQCTPGTCDNPAVVWEQAVPGWRPVASTDRFTLYAPAAGQSGRSGAVAGLSALGRALGPALGFRETFAAATVLESSHRPGAARRLVRRMYVAAGPRLAAEIRAEAQLGNLDPTR